MINFNGLNDKLHGLNEKLDGSNEKLNGSNETSWFYVSSMV